MGRVDKNYKNELFKLLNFNKVVTEGLPTFDNLVGFYDVESPWDLASVRKAIEPIIDWEEVCLAKCILISSLTEFRANVEFWDVKDKQNFAVLMERKWIRYGLTKSETNEDFVEVSMTNVPAADFECLCECIFRGHTYGYAFLYWPEHQLAAYPYEKYGFGFIAEPNSAGLIIAKSLLQSLDHRIFHVTC